MFEYSGQLNNKSVISGNVRVTLPVPVDACSSQMQGRHTASRTDAS